MPFCKWAAAKAGSSCARRGPDLDDIQIQIALSAAYDWAKEWQLLLAGVLVLLAALIVAWSVLRAARIRADATSQDRPDLRSSTAPAIAGPQPRAQDDIVTGLEQLRSFIRSALASLTLTAEKENSPALFLCQRIAHVRLERFALPSHAGKPAHELYGSLLDQLDLLRQNLKKGVQPADLSEILVQLNASARNLTLALAPDSDQRQQA